MKRLVILILCVGIVAALPTAALAQRDPFRPGITEDGVIREQPEGSSTAPDSSFAPDKGMLPRSGIDASDHIILSSLFIAVGFTMLRLARWGRFA